MKDSYSIKEFIEHGKTLNNLSFDSFCKKDNGVTNFNILYDYIDILKKYSKTVILNDKEYIEYQYKPKLLSSLVYGDSEYFYIILILNDITSFKEFDFKKIKLIPASQLSEILSNIYAKEQQRI